MFKVTEMCNDNGQVIPFEDAMTMSGFGKFNVFSVLYCGFMLLGMIMETLGFSIIIPASQCDLELSLLQKTWISVIPFIAIIITSHMWGYLADTRGRKKILFLCTTVGSIASIASSFAPNTETFGVIRFIAGIFIAGPSALGYAYLGELNPKEHRDKVLTLGNSSVGFGTAVVPLIAWGILPLDFHWNLLYLDYRPWRLLVCIFALPYLICALMMYKFPESPKFLAAQGQHEEALDVLREIYSINSGKPKESFPVSSLVGSGNKVDNNERSFLHDVVHQTMPLFSRKYFKYTALTCYLQFVIIGSANGFYIWFPVIVNKLLNGMNDVNVTGGNICDIFTSEEEHGLSYDLANGTISTCDDTLNTGAFLITIVLSIVVTLLSVTAAFSIKFVGKKFIIAAILFITSVASFVLEWITDEKLAIFLLATILINGVCIGVVNAYVVEIFPTNVRAMAVCLTFMVGRLGSMFASNAIGHLIHSFCYVTFFLSSALTFSCILLTYFLPGPSVVQILKKMSINEGTL